MMQLRCLAASPSTCTVWIRRLCKHSAQGLNGPLTLLTVWFGLAINMADALCECGNGRRGVREQLQRGAAIIARRPEKVPSPSGPLRELRELQWPGLLPSSGSVKWAACCATETWSPGWRRLWASSPGGTAPRCCSRCAPRCLCRSTAGKLALCVMGHGPACTLISRRQQSADNVSRFLLSMPTYMEKSGVLSTKLVCFYKREEGSSLPAVQTSVLLFDPEYGNVKAVSNAWAWLAGAANCAYILAIWSQAPKSCTCSCTSLNFLPQGHGRRGHDVHEDSCRLRHLH